MASLTVRAMAEMLQLPAYAQARILTDYKYPKQAQQKFRTPYYQPALTGIRKYFEGNRDKSQLTAAANVIASLKMESKRINNTRVLDKFAKSSLSKRLFQMQKNPSVRATSGSVELRFHPDLLVIEDGIQHPLFLNCRAGELDEELAFRTAEISHWVLEQNGIKIPIAQIEYFDLFTGKSISTKKRRAATIKALTQTTKIIEALWPTL